MVKVTLENREIGTREFLELTEDQFRLLQMLKNDGWLDEFSDYETYDEEPEFKRV